ncbi:2Fe-2S iron-sulfur cluster-binding protein [Desulforhopalus sp. IMCC35007]|uniref:2Fe-2S iron-sulfur cluster-binding protein n=1 Tax=Desulforhopalus sp. IMCC35007 TaxID=2569543 RepID=UPI0010AE3EC1|nr:2Fe-2S iron-sulfur cluster-binding protein [Desulforhopalus sp. IMCC35007]TKB07975.1 2Fe-2S iron-sulfur cluster binding domain-containing protein [Desulforhopalus sp. IMCC35007]
MAKITIDNTGATVEALPGRSLLLSLLNAEQPVHTVCGGKAGCGCCRVRILEGGDKLSPVNDPEKLRLGPEKIAEGWRLACQTHTLRDIVLYLPIAEELDSICSKK